MQNSFLIINNKIGIASDHRGYKLKNTLLEKLSLLGYKLIDYGCYSEDAVDYPDIVNNVVRPIIDKEIAKVILICFSGIGMSIAANRYQEIRAAFCQDKEDACLARKHNDANIIILAARKFKHELDLEIIQEFLSTDFEGGRHLQRINKIS